MKCKNKFNCKIERKTKGCWSSISIKRKNIWNWNIKNWYLKLWIIDVQSALNDTAIDEKLAEIEKDAIKTDESEKTLLLEEKNKFLV